MNSIILYENILKLGTLTATSTNATAGYHVNNLIDDRAYTQWKASSNAEQTIQVDLSSAQTADCIGIMNHNLGTAEASATVQYWNGSAWVTADTFNPSNDKALMRTFTLASATKWKLVLSGCGIAPIIGVIMLSDKLETEYLPESPVTPKTEGIVANVVDGENGAMLGADIRYNDLTISATYRYFSKTWLENSYMTFWNNYGKRLKPFFYAWDLTNSADDVYFGRIDEGSKFSAPRSRQNLIDELTINIKAISE